MRDTMTWLTRRCGERRSALAGLQSIPRAGRPTERVYFSRNAIKSASSSRVRRLINLSGINEFFCGVNDAMFARGICRTWSRSTKVTMLVFCSVMNPVSVVESLSVSS